MANTVNVTKLQDGPRHWQFHIYLESDGASGELTDETVIDPVVDMGLESSQRLAIQEITYSLSGFACRIEADYLVDGKMIWVMSDASANTVEFQEKYGGLYDRSEVDGTGKLQLTTTGFTTAGDMGSILITVRAQ